MNLVLVAWSKEELEHFANELDGTYRIQADMIAVISKKYEKLKRRISHFFLKLYIRLTILGR